MELLRNSRTLKALTDNSALNFQRAEEVIDATYVVIVANPTVILTAAGQAAALTAMVAASKTFRHVTLVCPNDVPLQGSPLKVVSLVQAAKLLGVLVAQEQSSNFTHAIFIGPGQVGAVPFEVHCWWDGWLAGVRNRFDWEPVGASWHPIAGSFAAAQAVREVFAQVCGKRGRITRSSSISLWEPWSTIEQAESGPSEIHLVNNIALVGLGHLGQGFLWNLLLLPIQGDQILIWDYQYTAEENIGTGVLTVPSDVGTRKTRVANRWLEAHGWKTALMEQKFTAGQKWSSESPSLVVSALDSPTPRRWILDADYPLMIDLGVGHGASDFEYGQLRMLPNGATDSWTNTEKQKSVEDMLRRPAYAQMADQCGAFALANSSVAVPYVGLAMGALAVSQLLRHGAMRSTRKVLQIELSAPDMASVGGEVPEPAGSLGSCSIELADRGAQKSIFPKSPGPHRSPDETRDGIHDIKEVQRT